MSSEMHEDGGWGGACYVFFVLFCFFNFLAVKLFFPSLFDREAMFLGVELKSARPSSC